MRLSLWCVLAAILFTLPGCDFPIGHVTHTDDDHCRGTRVLVGTVAALLLLTITATKADTRIETHDYYIAIRITGTITEHDAQIFEGASKDFEYVEPAVYLDSPGGSVSAAMKIGRLIRKYEGTTLISGRCYSSCALIFIAGVLRNIPTDAQALGLHRPFLAEVPHSREDVERQVPMMLTAVKTTSARWALPSISTSKWSTQSRLK
jgi:hypothetical protein